MKTGDLIELIGTFPHENYDYQNTNQFEDPIIIYTDTNRPKPPHVRPKPDQNQPEPDPPKPDWEYQNHYFHVKPSYHETTTQNTHYNDGDDDYVPVHTNAHKPQRPSFPGEMLFLLGCLGVR